MKKSNYVHALLWASAVVGSFYLETFWYAKIRYIRKVSFFDYRLTIIAVSMLIFTISVLLIYKIQERESKKNMSKEKQIENMIEIVKPFVSGLACGDESGSCELTDCRSCKARNLVNKLIESDCDKQSEGKWILTQEKRLFGDKYYTCSNCQGINPTMIKFNYCFNCGAKMKGD